MLNKYDFDLIIKKIWRAKFPFIYRMPFFFGRKNIDRTLKKEVN